MAASPSKKVQDERRNAARGQAWIVVSSVLLLAVTLGPLARLAAAGGDERAGRVPGLALVATRPDAGAAGSRRVLLEWGALVASARALGLACEERKPAGGGVPATAGMVDCQVLPKDGWAVEIPGMTVGSGQLANGRSLMHFGSAGLFGGLVWLDSAAQLTSAREAIARLAAADARPAGVAAGHDEQLQVESVRLAITENGSRPRGTVSITYVPLAPADPAPDPTQPSEGPYKVGGPVSPPRIVPGTKVEPRYTDLARKARVDGRVIVRATIDEGGNVIAVQVLKGLPLGLDRAAVEAVTRWKFTPAVLDDRPVKVFFDIAVPFEPPAR